MRMGAERCAQFRRHRLDRVRPTGQVLNKPELALAAIRFRGYQSLPDDFVRAAA